MFHRKRVVGFMIVGVLLLSLVLHAGPARACKILIVMTYWEEFFWSLDLKKGIDGVLADQCELKYAYMDVMKSPDSVDAKVQEIYALYQEWQPDGVIAANDDAQSKFVVPYLKEKVDIPVIFCGIFADPATYGYPASNVSGVLESAYFKESIAFLRQLVPDAKSFAMVGHDAVAAHEVAAALEGLANELSLEFHGALLTNDMDELVERVKQTKEEYDLLFIPPVVGEDTTKKNCFRCLKNPRFQPGVRRWNMASCALSPKAARCWAECRRK